MMAAFWNRRAVFWRGTTGMANLLIVLGLILPPAVAAKPCTCDDVKKIEDTIQMIHQTRDAWLDVLASILDDKSNAPNTMAEAKESFHKRMGWSSTTQQGGIDPNTGEVKLDPKFVEENCDSIVNGVIVHEHTHLWYGAGHGLQAHFADPRDMARMLAEGEIWARDRQEAFLKDELENLMQKCGQWRCKCTGRMFESAAQCSQGCPKAAMSCIAPTCYEIDPKTGKNTGKAY
jgi:predicted SprT family Zn-dependent metalloprotease